MKLFEDKIRSDKEPANKVDNDYDFYDRSAWGWVNDIREILNGWFNALPNTEKKEMKSRFKKEFDSPFFELFLHELFTRLGYEIHIHPELPNSDKKPDFLLRKDEQEFYLEAKIARDKSDLEIAIENREGVIIDAINKTNSPNFYLFLRGLLMKSKEQPNGKKIRKYFESKLPLYDPDSHLEKLAKENDYIEQLEYEDERVKVSIELWPKDKEYRGKGGRAIGLESHKLAAFQGPEDYLKIAIMKKAKRYGKLNYPYIIAINGLGTPPIENFLVWNTLFGTDQITVVETPDGTKTYPTRANNGIFSFKSDRNIIISSVFLTTVHPASIKDPSHWLIPNPRAINALDLSSIGLSYFDFIDGTLTEVENNSVRSIFNIPNEKINLSDL